MEYIRFMAIGKKIRLVVIPLFVAVLWFAYENDAFLPRAHIAVGFMEWGERNYYPEDGNYRYAVGKKIAVDGGYYIFCLDGDTKKEYKAVAQGTGWGIGQFSLEHTLFLQEGYTIPLTGTVTGAVITSGNSRFGKYISASRAEDILRKIQISGDENQSGSRILTTQISVSENSQEVWLCYDNCPVSGTLAGYLEKRDGGLYFITENAVYPISETDY